MTIDAVALSRSLTELRELAAAKLAAEPLPVGKDADERIREDIERYDLKAEVADLETKGYAVLPPGKAAPMDFIDRLRDAILTAAEDDESLNLGPQSGLGHTVFHLLPQDRVFEEALMAPAPLTLVTYLLGYRAKLSQMTGLVKESDAAPLAVHADHSNKLPAPWPSLAQYCNINWICSDYTREMGPLVLWPGSHRWGRPVPADLRMAQEHPEMEVMEVERGSVLVWHGSLWHGALPRTAPGKRVTLVMPHVRDYIQAQELYWATTRPEMIERNPARFSTLVGLTSGYPWIQDGPPSIPLGGGITGSQFE